MTMMDEAAELLAYYPLQGLARATTRDLTIPNSNALSGVSCQRRRRSSNVRRNHVSSRTPRASGICKAPPCRRPGVHPAPALLFPTAPHLPLPYDAVAHLLSLTAPRPPRFALRPRTVAPPPAASAAAAAMPLAAEPDDTHGEGENQQLLITTKGGPGLEGLVVGSYCHDVLIRGGRVVGETLGGAAAFVSNVLDAASPWDAALNGTAPFVVVAKVGHDFVYASAPAPARHPPLLCASPTTSFHAQFSETAASAHAPDRELRRVRACDPIYPADLPDRRFAYGLAVGVAGEVLPETLEQMIRLCRAVLVDAQALIRAFDGDGAVGHVALDDTPYARLLPRVAFVKASSEEAPYVGVETARRWCCVIVTEGRDGCRLYWNGGEASVMPFPAVQVDPTGAGDSFLAGFATGLLWGLSATDAALLGNFFGAAAVSQVGVPTFHSKMLQAVKEILEEKTTKRYSPCINGTNFTLEKSNMHNELHAALQEAAMLMSEQQQADKANGNGGDICSPWELTSQ